MGVGRVSDAPIALTRGGRRGPGCLAAILRVLIVRRPASSQKPSRASGPYMSVSRPVSDPRSDPYRSPRERHNDPPHVVFPVSRTTLGCIPSVPQQSILTPPNATDVQVPQQALPRDLLVQAGPSGAFLRVPGQGTTRAGANAPMPQRVRLTRRTWWHTAADGTELVPRTAWRACSTDFPWSACMLGLRRRCAA